MQYYLILDPCTKDVKIHKENGSLVEFESWYDLKRYGSELVKKGLCSNYAAGGDDDETKAIIPKRLIKIEPTLREVIGNIIPDKAEKRGCDYTDKGIYIAHLRSNIKDNLDFPVRLHTDGNTGEINSIGYASSLLAHVYLEDNKPKILTGYPGDNRGCLTFNKVFISSGHDGNYIFNIDNPDDNTSGRW
jgi:hypothetical protein